MIANRQTRRALFAIAGTTALAGCGLVTSTTTNGVTTLTLDTKTITNDGQALIAALTAAISAPSVAALLGPNAAVASLALTAASTALAQIQNLTGGSVSVSYDPTSVQGFVSTLLKSAASILALIQAALAKVTGTIATTVGNYVAAAQTLLPFIALAAQIAMPASASTVRTGMTEKDALKAAYAQ